MSAKKTVLLEELNVAFEKHIVPILNKYLEPNDTWQYGWWMKKNKKNEIFIDGIKITKKS